MQITVTIADKFIKAGIEEILNNEIYQYFDKTTIKMSKAPKISTRVNEIFNDPKFQKDLEKRILRYVNLVDEMRDAIGDVNVPMVDDMVKSCRKIEETREADIEAQQEADNIKRTIKALELAGYKVSKK